MNPNSESFMSYNLFGFTGMLVVLILSCILAVSFYLAKKKHKVLEQSYVTLHQLYDALIESKTTLVAQIVENVKCIADLNKREADLRVSYNQDQEELAEFDKRMDAANQDMAYHKRIASSAEKQSNNKQIQIDKLQKELEEATNTIEKYEEAGKSLRKALSDANVKLEDARHFAKYYEDGTDTLKQKLESIKNAYPAYASSDLVVLIKARDKYTKRIVVLNQQKRNQLKVKP